MVEKYENLKCLIYKEVGDEYNLESVKQYFKDKINSLRLLSRIKSLPELIEALEKRDVLNYLSPLPLLYLGRDVLKNSKVAKYVQVYKERILDNDYTICNCGEKYNCAPPPTEQYLQVEGTNFTKCYSSNKDVEEAIKSVANRITNNDWRVLASELNVLECQIDDCYAKYPNDPKKQAYRMLQYWLENNKENTSIELLDKALTSRLCLKRGFGTHFRIPLILINS